MRFVRINMHRHGLLVPTALAAVALAAAATAAERSTLPAKPYAPVTVVLPGATNDASFAAFRAELAATAKRRIYSELARLVQPEGFFWARDFGHRFDPRLPAVDNLAAAIRLEHDDGAGWETLAAFAAETSVEPLVSRPGIVCAPAEPSYDGIAFTRLLDTTYTGLIDWVYPLTPEMPVRAAPRPQSALVGMVGLYFVRLLGFAGPHGAPAPERHQWARVATPAGKVGFVAPASLRSLESERLCYVKDLVGGWRIAGFIAGSG